MFPIFHVVSVNNFFTVAAENRTAAIQLCAIRERVSVLDLVSVKPVEGCSTGRSGILGQEAA